VVHIIDIVDFQPVAAGRTMSDISAMGPQNWSNLHHEVHFLQTFHTSLYCHMDDLLAAHADPDADGLSPLFNSE